MIPRAKPLTGRILPALNNLWDKLLVCSGGMLMPSKGFIDGVTTFYSIEKDNWVVGPKMR